jgi:hypothetical protein
VLTKSTWISPAENEHKTTIVLRHTGGKRFRVLKAKPTIPQIKVVWASKNSAAKHKIEVTLFPKAKAGGFTFGCPQATNHGSPNSGCAAMIYI